MATLTFPAASSAVDARLRPVPPPSTTAALVLSGARVALWLLLAALIPATVAAGLHLVAIWTQATPAPDALGNELWWLVNAGVVMALASGVMIVLGLLQLAGICRWVESYEERFPHEAD